MRTRVKTVYKPVIVKEQHLPFFEARVSAGFPSPAADYEENKLDLNKYLIKNSAATFFVRVSGDSMEGAGIYNGDLLVVDRSIQPTNGKIIIAVINGELTVKRIKINKKKISLVPENKNYPEREISEENEFEVWGVVTSVIHQL